MNLQSPLLPSGPWLGPENALAARAAEALARRAPDDEGPSLLLLHGPSGVGKSRLLAEIVAERLRVAPGAAVAHFTAEAFGEACAEASRGPLPGSEDEHGVGWPELRARLRGAELFALDDLEGLRRAPAARGELLHTLEALELSGAAVVLASRAPPASWSRREWPARLIGRLTGGLVVAMVPPGLATRRGHLLRRSAEAGILLASETVERLALAADGFAALDGWLARLALEDRLARQAAPPGASSSTSSRPRPIGLGLVESALADDPRLSADPLGPAAAIDAIARAVAARFGVRLKALRGPDRHAALAEPRHLAMYLARARSGASVAAIAAYFGNRDRATVRHACRAAAARIDQRPDLAAVAEEIVHNFEFGTSMDHA